MTQAAGRLNVAQPSLSRDIRLLEQEFGKLFFHRNGRGVELTPEGRLFRDAIADPVRALDRAEAAWLDRTKDAAGTIRLGWTGSISFPIGNVVITGFMRQCPNMEFQARVGSSAQIIDWVRNGDLDLGVMNAERPASEPGAETLLKSHLYFVAAEQPGSNADPSAPISFAEAARWPLFVHSSQNATGRIVDKTARDLGIKLKIAAEVDDFSTVRPLIAAGHAATIIPKSLLWPTMAGGSVMFRRITAPDLPIYFILQFGRTKRNAAAAAILADIIRQETRRAVAAGTLDGVLEA